jgi:predicted MFS family arabinose efflux permease
VARSASVGRRPLVPRRDVGAMLATAVYGLPAYVFAALAVQIDVSVGLPTWAVGGAFGTFFGASALFTIVFTALGAPAVSSLRLAAWLTAATLVALASMDHWRWLFPCLCLAGAANALGQVAANRFISEGGRTDGLGLAFGLKQSGVPLAALCGGAAVPAIALTVGWREAYVGAAVIALVFARWIGGFPEHDGRPRRAAGGRPPGAPLLWLFAIAGALGAASADALGAYFVSSGVAVGASESFAGTTLAVGSLVCVLCRIWMGHIGDGGNGDVFAPVSLLLLAGGVGYVLLALRLPLLLLPAAVLCFAGGWGWPGLLYFGVARLHDAAPAAATSVVQAGIFVGAVLGPVAFGLATETWSYRLAWLGAALAAALAAALILVGGRRARRRGDEPWSRWASA